VDPSESYIDQIGFEYMIDAVIIFSSFILKSVKITFRIEYDQRVIINCLLNERNDTRDTAEAPQAQFY
jgi:hypothetical protein